MEKLQIDTTKELDSEEDCNYILDLEKQWRKSVPRFTCKELLTIFPEAKPILKQKLREYSNEVKFLTQEIKEDLEKLYKQVTDEFSLWFWEKYLEVFKGEQLKQLSKKIKEIKFALNPPRVREGRITDEMIERAKQYPFENLIDTKRDFALCPFHSEKKPSFYVKNNWGYCFGCGWHGDTIKFLMEQNDLTFQEAIKYLT